MVESKNDPKFRSVFFCFNRTACEWAASFSNEMFRAKDLLCFASFVLQLPVWIKICLSTHERQEIARVTDIMIVWHRGPSHIDKNIISWQSLRHLRSVSVWNSKHVYHVTWRLYRHKLAPQLSILTALSRQSRPGLAKNSLRPVYLGHGVHGGNQVKCRQSLAFSRPNESKSNLAEELSRG